MKAKAAQESGRSLEITYTTTQGRYEVGTFPIEDLERCVYCNRNTPKEYMQNHISWDH